MFKKVLLNNVRHVLGVKILKLEPDCSLVAFVLDFDAAILLITYH